jgi:hypothetical protein
MFSGVAGRNRFNLIFIPFGVKAAQSAIKVYTAAA